MKQAIGCDIEEISRFRILDREGTHPFFHRVYTEREVAHCLGRGNPYAHLAARFSGKEAVIKALAALGIGGIRHRDVEIMPDSAGYPTVHMRREGIRPLLIHLSLSHSKTSCMAVALALEV